MISTIRALTIAALCLAYSPLASADLTKEQCLDAHSRGQDAKEQNHLSLARKLFLTCAQQSCPAVVQGDCARFADDLSRMQPSINLIARDGNGNDLPDTTVYVDGELLVTRLDGSPHDVDPGSHTVKFQNAGKEQIVTLVIGSGEKGRAVTATFGSPTPPAAGGAALGVKSEPTQPKEVEVTKHAGASKIVLWGGVALVGGGAALAFLGHNGIPSNCDLGTHQCAAPPGDPSFGKASSAAKLYDTGWAMGIVGLAAIGGGLAWYITSSHTEKETIGGGMAVVPWFAPTGGGLALGGDL